nr:pentatricopeptide repeat-containing protein [Quercus suber]
MYRASFFTELLHCTQQKDLRNGKALHAQILKSASTCVYLANNLVNLYAKCGNLDKARLVFENIPEKDVVSWNCLINGYSQHGPTGSSFVMKLFQRMRAEDTLPNAHTFAGVFTAASNVFDVFGGQQAHALAIKTASFYDVFVGSSLLNTYCKVGLVLEAQGKLVHGYSLKMGYESQIYMMTALVDMYAKCGSVVDARKGFDYLREPDIVLWTSMISGYVQNGNNESALSFYCRMQMEGIMPNELTMASVLKACSSLAALEQGRQIHARIIKYGFSLEIPIGSALSTIHMGLVEQGSVYFKMMFDKFGIVPRLEHYACMVDILSRAGKLNEAKAFIESATIDHGMCLWRILLGACKNYHNYKLGAYAGEKLMKLGSQESSAYVLLSSIYTALGKQEEVERVRKIMKLRGVNKEPGCSWIDLKNMTHVFVVGDQMHPHIGDIRGELWMLAKLMEDEGYEPTFELTSLTH